MTETNNYQPLPLTTDEITPAWLTAALKIRRPDAEVTGVEIVDMIRGTCTKIRLRLHYAPGRDAGLPATMILKGGFEPHSRDMFVTHEKEVRAYRDLFPTLKLHSPDCYFADFSEEQQQGVVLIEDLVARGVEFCHPQRPQTKAAVAARLSALARFHAASWDSPKLAPGGDWDWAKDLLVASCEYMPQYLQTEALDRFVASPRGAAASVRFHSREWLTDSLEQLPRLAVDVPRCLIHGDTHLGNLYVDADGTPGFYDPQPMAAPALAEVAYHITGALDLAGRHHWEQDLIRHYLRELENQGIAAPDFDNALRQYSAYLVIGFCIFLVNESHFQPEAINTAYTARFSQAMLDNNTAEILAAID